MSSKQRDAVKKMKSGLSWPKFRSEVSKSKISGDVGELWQLYKDSHDGSAKKRQKKSPEVRKPIVKKSSTRKTKKSPSKSPSKKKSPRNKGKEEVRGIHYGRFRLPEPSDRGNVPVAVDEDGNYWLIKTIEATGESVWGPDNQLESEATKLTAIHVDSIDLKM